MTSWFPPYLSSHTDSQRPLHPLGHNFCIFFFSFQWCFTILDGHLSCLLSREDECASEKTNIRVKHHSGKGAATVHSVSVKRHYALNEVPINGNALKKAYAACLEKCYEQAHKNLELHFLGSNSPVPVTNQ